MIYEYNISGHRSTNGAKNHLMRSFDDMFLLYIKILAIFGELVHTAEDVIEVKKQKYLPTTTDLQPNEKFIKNKFIKKLTKNTSLQKHLNEKNLWWNNAADAMFARKIYDSLLNQDFFIAYMQSDEKTFETDKQLVLSILEKFMLENEDMIRYFGEIKISWLHDYNDVIVLIYNTLKTFTYLQNDNLPLPTLFKTSNEKESEELIFAQSLLLKTIINNRDYTEIIAQKLQNWELERIACIDSILLKMAICEFCEFPSIPLRVTLNEYIEISKYYSTPKSRNFINGLLDNVLLYLKQENKINKQGRGLMG